MIARFTRFDLSSLLASPARMIGTLAFVVVIAVINPYPALAIAAAAAATSLGVGTPFLNDERGRLDVLYAILPISRRSVVIGRYLVMLSWYLAASVIAIVAAVVVSAERQIPLALGSVLFMQALSLVIVALTLGVQLPIFFGLGFTRARAMMFIPIVVAGALGALGAGLFGDTTTLSKLVSSSLVPLIAAVIAVAALIVSAIVAVRVYSNREV